MTAAVVVAIGLGMVSCVDKADNSVTPSDKEQQAEDAKQEKSQKFWAVVSQLVDVDDYTDDYEGKTFEPTYGVAQGDDGTRYVFTNTAAAAAARFADLVERDDIDENTQSYTYDDPDVGKLVYTKGTGKILATVEVSIKQIPTLKKIVYIPGAYANGNFQGKAYYRFGDVVSRTVVGLGAHGNDTTLTEYWVCVRPSWGMEGKGDSHWVCLNALPKKNVKHYHSKSNGKDYYLPTGLSSSEEHMQNLAEMMFAMANPGEWEENVGQHGADGLRMFHDLNRNNIKYHNRYFWQSVVRAWRTYNVSEKVLGMTSEDMARWYTLHGNMPDIRLLHSGYHWFFTTSWYCTLYEACYSYDNATPAKKNMHSVAYNKVEKHMQEMDLDCRVMGPDGYDNYSDFFDNDDEPRWTVRHATGKELAADGKYNPKEPIDGVKEVYRYYRDVKPTKNLNENPEVTQESDVLPLAKNVENGYGVYMLGDVVKDEYDNRWFCISGTPVYPKVPGATDSLATFVSFDFNEVNTSGNTVPGLPTAEEIPDLAFRMIIFLFQLHVQKDDFQFIAGSEGQLGKTGQHILDYANVDLRKIFMDVDSVFTFTSKNIVYNSLSESFYINIAYNDGSPDKQAVCRSLIDNTLAGNKRGSCKGVSGKEYNDFYYRIFLHYEDFDVERMDPLTADQVGLGINDWCRTWPMSNDKMYLQDVANQAMVDRYARFNKWSTLPLTGGSGEHHPVRTKAETSAKPSDYIGHFGANGGASKTNIFNEPVCFLRVMKVKDLNNKNFNLVSEDGRKLTIVHVQDDKVAYNEDYQGLWVMKYITGILALFLDNKEYTLPSIPGL